MKGLRIPQRYRVASIATLISIAGLAALWWVLHADIAVLNPAGTVAAAQRRLIVFAVVLSLIVIVPVYVMAVTIAWRYRAGSPKAGYRPNWDYNRKAELIWWGIPIVIISILAVVTWKTSHDLDPYRQLASDKKPLTVQVVALQWRWLFIYPEQNVASINYLQIPTDRPVNFKITSDAPMNSFWIPKLGGQVYAMAGMNTELHLMATQAGTYHGWSANISGEGFSDMRFVVQAGNEADFDAWVATVRRSDAFLTRKTYDEIAKPSEDSVRRYFAAVDQNLYTNVIDKYLVPGAGAPTTPRSPSHTKDED